MDTVVRTLNQNWWLVLLQGVLSVVLGVLALAWPGVTLGALILLWGLFALPGVGLLTLVYLVGIYAIMYGVITCLLAFRLHSLPERMARTLVPPAGAAPSH